MFDWGVLKCGHPKSVWFYIDDLPMYTFLIPTHPYSLPTGLTIMMQVNTVFNLGTLLVL